MDKLTKSYPVEFKTVGEGSDAGQFEALVSVFGNVDIVGDRVMPGAFTDTLKAWEASGDPIPVLWSHQWSDPESHIGYVLEAAERDDGLWVKGQLDLDAPRAAQVFRLLKSRRVKEFSFAYDVQRQQQVEEHGEWINELLTLDLFEVGPTLKGTNPATQLIGAKAAVGTHSTATTDQAWDGPANKTRVLSDQPASYYRRIFAWQDPDGDVGNKSSWKFIHHQVAEDGTPGAANITACRTGIGVLNGGRTGTTIPDSDRQGVYNHLAKHLRDADIEPPALKSTEEARLASLDTEALKALRDSIDTLLDGEAEPDDEIEEGDEPAGFGIEPADVDLIAAIEAADI